LSLLSHSNAKVVITIFAEWKLHLKHNFRQAHATNYARGQQTPQRFTTIEPHDQPSKQPTGMFFQNQDPKYNALNLNRLYLIIKPKERLVLSAICFQKFSNNGSPSNTNYILLLLSSINIIWCPKSSPIKKQIPAVNELTFDFQESEHAQEQTHRTAPVSHKQPVYFVLVLHAPPNKSKDQSVVSLKTSSFLSTCSLVISKSRRWDTNPNSSNCFLASLKKLRNLLAHVFKLQISLVLQQFNARDCQVQACFATKPVIKIFKKIHNRNKNKFIQFQNQRK